MRMTDSLPRLDLLMNSDLKKSGHFSVNATDFTLPKRSLGRVEPAKRGSGRGGRAGSTRYAWSTLPEKFVNLAFRPSQTLRWEGEAGTKWWRSPRSVKISAITFALTWPPRTSQPFENARSAAPRPTLGSAIQYGCKSE